MSPIDAMVDALSGESAQSLMALVGVTTVLTAIILIGIRGRELADRSPISRGRRVAVLLSAVVGLLAVFLLCVIGYVQYAFDKNLARSSFAGTWFVAAALAFECVRSLIVASRQ